MRLTRTTRDVLDVFLADPDGETYGLQLCQVTGLGPGTVYPILSRLVQAGWLQSSWQDDHSGRGARRRLYRMTDKGRVEAHEALKAREAMFGARFGWAP
ncbi:PadR family transcriptional regulator [Streptosporangium sandarakinum]|uniref:PadR family transcriptional regulator n=1 Tax=Streptosporangium sandarakinum TaxID=1260955 RepID=UPI00371A2958